MLENLDLQALTAIGAGLAALYAGWKSHRADKQTRATGNGFAKHTTERLERIEALTHETHALMVEHLADHAGSDLTRK